MDQRQPTMNVVAEEPDVPVVGKTHDSHVARPSDGAIDLDEVLATLLEHRFILGLARVVARVEVSEAELVRDQQHQPEAINAFTAAALVAPRAADELASHGHDFDAGHRFVPSVPPKPSTLSLPGTSGKPPKLFPFAHLVTQSSVKRLRQPGVREYVSPTAGLNGSGR